MPLSAPQHKPGELGVSIPEGGLDSRLLLHLTLMGTAVGRRCCLSLTRGGRGARGLTLPSARGLQASSCKDPPPHHQGPGKQVHSPVQCTLGSDLIILKIQLLSRQFILSSTNQVGLCFSSRVLPCRSAASDSRSRNNDCSHVLRKSVQTHLQCKTHFL